MLRPRSVVLATLASATLAFIAPTSQAKSPTGDQICSLASPGVGQQGTLLCKNILNGGITQSIPLGNTVSDAGGIGGSLSRHSDRVLVANQAGGAILFRVVDGALKLPVVLQTNGEGSLSGALSDHGAYVLTGTSLRFFPNGQTTPTSTQHLLVGDGSAAEVTLTNRYAYVSEKSGTLEAFPLARDGSLAGPASNVTGVDPGVIVGIAGDDDLVVAPIAHLASNPGQSEISVASGQRQVELVPTKEVAACWADAEDDEACVSNPGSMTISCGELGPNGFLSYTSAAASVPGESLFDLDMRDGLVGVQGLHGGAPVLVVYARGDGDFLSFMNEVPVGATKAAGALLLPAMH
jgi:hypothetical protein